MTSFATIGDQEWLALLLRSLENRQVDGIRFPAFPRPEVQQQFVGSSGEHALREGFEFYRLVKAYASALGMQFGHSTTLLDFGCGWGRYLRFFWKDVEEENLYGADVDPDILEECRRGGVPGQLTCLTAMGDLPYPSGHFDCIVAYSVFTHLPEAVHMHWVHELNRVARPGCVFVLTLEPARFLDFVGGLATSESASGWHRALAQYSGRAAEMSSACSRGEFVYLPTGGGDYRSVDVYGDAVVPRAWIEKNWNDLFAVRDYIDDPGRFWQAVLIAQKP